LETTLTIDAGKYDSDFGFVQTGNSNKQGILIAFIVLTVVFFILGLIATIIYCAKKGQLQANERSNSQEDMNYSPVSNNEESSD
jgi:flagellar basal body-associated protein FliL